MRGMTDVICGAYFYESNGLFWKLVIYSSHDFDFCADRKLAFRAFNRRKARIRMRIIMTFGKDVLKTKTIPTPTMINFRHWSRAPKKLLKTSNPWCGTGQIYNNKSIFNWRFCPQGRDKKSKGLQGS